jgi:hypothetical protein
MYFLGQEDRNMKNGAYGLGDYIYIDNQFYAIESYDETTQLLVTSTMKTFHLDLEPDFELFMEKLGYDWDNRYKEQWQGDEDYTDYVPIYYSTRADFVTKKPIWYNK